jgi:hypothetical protein
MVVIWHIRDKGLETTGPGWREFSGDKIESVLLHIPPNPIVYDKPG